MGIKNGKIRLGAMERGKRNLITDVPGVTVGHVTLTTGPRRTGVTAILPHGGNLFRHKVMAAVHVINGFGKSLGLVQVEELGSIETPILLTNTLSVGTAATALTKYMLAQNPDIGVSTGTVNCLVTECNDGLLNDIRGLHVKEEHVLQAIWNASPDFQEGAVGAGTGMICQGFKGGIGSASRLIPLGGQKYVLGALVMTNFGCPGDLVIRGEAVGQLLAPQVKERLKALPGGGKAAAGGEALPKRDRGSVIIVLATDLPLSERQLKRVAKRAVVGLARTGSYLGNGSGDIVIAFSTENIIPHYSEDSVLPAKRMFEDDLDDVFRAAAETVEESVVSSLVHAATTTGYSGKVAFGLSEFMEL